MQRRQFREAIAAFRAAASRDPLVADAAARFSEIPQVLLAINSAPARKAVVDYLVADGKSDGNGAEIIRDLRFLDSGVSVDARGVLDVQSWEHGGRRPGLLLPVDDLL